MQVNELRTWIRKAIAREGGQIKYADKHQIDRAVMSLVLNGHREPSDEFVGALGFERVVTYRRKKEKANESE